MGEGVLDVQDETEFYSLLVSRRVLEWGNLLREGTRCLIIGDVSAVGCSVSMSEAENAGLEREHQRVHGSGRGCKGDVSLGV